MTGIGPLSQNISANVVSNAWSAALSLLLTPFYVSLLGVESYGLIAFYASWTAILGILDTGISSTALRESAWMSARLDQRPQIPTLLRSLEVAYWGIMLGIGGGLLITAWWVGESWFLTLTLPPHTARAALMLMAISLVVQVPSGLYVGGLMGLQRQVESAVAVALFGTLRGVGALAVLYLVRADIRTFFLWQLVASAVQTGILRWWLMRAVRVEGHPARFSLRMLQNVRQFAGGMSVITALSLVLAQIDKMVLSRLVPLETFGVYMLAWTVASGLSRVATPVVHAFSPRFTGLVSEGKTETLGKQLRIASQLTSVLILPSAALLVWVPDPILRAWIGNAGVAAEASPLLRVLTFGTVFSACSFPAASVLYSQKRLKPVIVVNSVAAVVLVPMLVIAVVRAGSMGAALCWSAYGLATYLAYQTLALMPLSGSGPVRSMVQDFVVPGLAALAVGGVVWTWSTAVTGTAGVIAMVAIGLVVGGIASLLVCRELRQLVAVTLGWQWLAPRLSA